MGQCCSIEGYTVGIPMPKGNMKLQEKDCFAIRVMPSSSNVDGEKDELIHKQEAVCRLCSHMLGEVDSVLKIKCDCQFGLIHTTCANQWSATECVNCLQVTQNIPVTLSNPRPKEHQAQNKKGGCCSIL